VNIVVGPNASGKTNLLEAILVLCRGSSYRARDIDLVQNDQEWARLDSTDEQNQTRVVKLQKQGEKIDKTFEIDEQTRKRLNFAQTIPIVLFEPNQLQSITTSPSQRRLFIDDLLSQIDPEYSKQQRNYERVLAQRNALLKQKPQDAAQQLFVWNLRLSEFGAVIANKRQAIIETINAKFTNNYKRLPGARMLLLWRTKANVSWTSTAAHY